jgi:hypothetical protein
MATDIDGLIEAIRSGRDLSLTEQAKLVDILQDKKGQNPSSLPSTMVIEAHQAMRELDRLHYIIFVSAPEIGASIKWAVKTQMNWLCAATNYVEADSDSNGKVSNSQKRR